MADALADITSFQLCGFTYEDPNEVCPKIWREDGLAELDLLVLILESWGSSGALTDVYRKPFQVKWCSPSMPADANTISSQVPVLTIIFEEDLNQTRTIPTKERLI